MRTFTLQKSIIVINYSGIFCLIQCLVFIFRNKFRWIFRRGGVRFVIFPRNCSGIHELWKGSVLSSGEGLQTRYGGQAHT